MKKITRQHLRAERRKFEKIMGITTTKALDDIGATAEDAQAYGLTRTDIELFILFGDVLIENHVVDDVARWGAWTIFKANALASIEATPSPMTNADMKAYMMEQVKQMAEEHSAMNGRTRVTMTEYEALDENEIAALMKSGGITITDMGSISYGFGDDDDTF